MACCVNSFALTGSECLDPTIALYLDAGCGYMERLIADKLVRRPYTLEEEDPPVERCTK
jgi:hypothetical protein